MEGISCSSSEERMLMLHIMPYEMVKTDNMFYRQYLEQVYENIFLSRPSRKGDIETEELLKSIEKMENIIWKSIWWVFLVVFKEDEETPTGIRILYELMEKLADKKIIKKYTP